MRQALEQHPALGYISALVAALPPWALDLREWVGIAATLVGLAVGLFTLALQIRQWRKNR